MRMKKFLVLLAVFSGIAALIIKTEEVAQGVGETLILCVNSVIPSLFPFFIMSGLLVNTGLVSLIGKFLAPVSHRLFKTSGKGAVVFVIGLLCGYPTGAKVTADLCQQGKLTKTEGERLIAFCNNSGPLFVIGAVGGGMIGSRDVGVLLYVIHAISAVLTGIFLSLFSNGTVHKDETEYTTTTLGKAFSVSVESAVKSILNVCGYVVFFGCIMAVLRPLIPSIFTGALLEVTVGAESIAAANLPTSQMLVLLSGVIGFGGLCVYLQVQGVVSSAGLSTRTYLIGKIIQMLISMLLTKTYLYFNRDIMVFAPVVKHNVVHHISFVILFIFLLCVVLSLKRLTKKN